MVHDLVSDCRRLSQQVTPEHTRRIHTRSMQLCVCGCVCARVCVCVRACLRACVSNLRCLFVICTEVNSNLYTPICYMVFPLHTHTGVVRCALRVGGGCGWVLV